MKIFFDVDFTLVGVDRSLRPGVHEVFRRLREDGHEVYLWSGQRNPWHAVNDYNLQEYVVNCYRKPIEDHHFHIKYLNIPTPDFCVDDNREIIDVFGGYTIPPYIYPENPDEHMWRVYDAIQEMLAHRHNGGVGEPRDWRRYNGT
ncbi:MAG: hypothetical protein HY689_14470 [Chloroflexi bacterium]|nr:hypothetical protein [Chloroflexota bacterium]